MRIELGDGLALRPATDADLEYIHANLRPGDAAEHNIDADGFDTIENLPNAKAIEKDGELIGYIGSFPMPNETVWSPRRYVYYLSTTHADKHKLEYVKRTAEVLRAVVKEMPDWVTEVATVSMPEVYPMACKWLERILKFEPVRDMMWRGAKHRLYRKQRKEI
jgi:hypothetical protein